MQSTVSVFVMVGGQDQRTVFQVVVGQSVIVEDLSGRGLGVLATRPVGTSRGRLRIPRLTAVTQGRQDKVQQLAGERHGPSYLFAFILSDVKK